MFWNRKKRVERIWARLDALAARHLVGELLFVSTVGVMLRGVDQAIVAKLIEEFRKSILVKVTDVDPDRAQAVALEMEERAAQMLDQIEHMARAPAP